MIIPATFGYHTAGCDQEIPSATDNEVRAKITELERILLVWNGKSEEYGKTMLARAKVSFWFQSIYYSYDGKGYNETSRYIIHSILDEG